jgi:hypothetical protein
MRVLVVLDHPYTIASAENVPPVLAHDPRGSRRAQSCELRVRRFRVRIAH